MDVLRGVSSKRRKQLLSTRRKMSVLIAMNLDSRNLDLFDKNSNSESISKNLLDTGQVLSFLQNEQYYIECLKHLKKCLIQPVVKENIDSLDDIIDLIDEMISAHSGVCSNIISGKSDMSSVLKKLLTSMDSYFSYSVFINLEMKNFQKLCETMDVYIDFDLLQEPMTHIFGYKSLHHVVTDEAYCTLLKAIEITSKNIENALLLKKNALRTLQIQQLLVKREPKILVPGRTVLKEGVLYKVSSRGTCMKERVFFLFSDIFLCCKLLPKRSDWHKKNSLLFQALFPLNMCLVSLVMGSAKQGALFKVTCGTMSYLLASKYPGDALSWFHELEAAIRTCQRSTVNLKPKLKRQTNISLRMKGISPFLKKPIKPDFQKEGEAANSSQTFYKKPPSHESIFRLLSCKNM